MSSEAAAKLPANERARACAYARLQEKASLARLLLNDGYGVDRVAMPVHNRDLIRDLNRMIPGLKENAAAQASLKTLSSFDLSLIPEIYEKFGVKIFSDVFSEL